MISDSTEVRALVEDLDLVSPGEGVEDDDGKPTVIAASGLGVSFQRDVVVECARHHPHHPAMPAKKPKPKPVKLHLPQMPTIINAAWIHGGEHSGRIRTGSRAPWRPWRRRRAAVEVSRVFAAIKEVLAAAAQGARLEDEECSDRAELVGLGLVSFRSRVYRLVWVGPEPDTTPLSF